MHTLTSRKRAGWPRTGATVGALYLVSLGACHSAPVAPPPPAPFKPSYAFSTNAAPTKADVSIAVLNPVVKGAVYGADGAEMLKALPTAFVDLITAKGMRYKGPFGALEEMTFPEKRESDLGLYAELDVVAGWEVQNAAMATDVSAWSGAVTSQVVCDVRVISSGKVSFVAIEPMSNETVWRKTVPVELPPTMINRIHGNRTCQGPAGGTSASPPLDGEFGNAFRKQLEQTFLAIMKGIDRYMSAEEFAVLKTQAAELKAKKAY